MVRPQTWQEAWEADISACLAQGLTVLDVEVLWIPQGGQLDTSHDLIIDVGNRLGAENLLVVSDEANPDRLNHALRHISQRCASSGMRPCLEFLRITQVTSLSQARELLDACQQHNFGILIDTLHLQRCGEFAQFLQNSEPLDPSQFPYMQLCDGYLECAADQTALLEDALDLRSPPGQGQLPLRPLMQRLPTQLPLSLEIRSKTLRDQYPDPLARAQTVLEQTHNFLESLDE